MFKVEINTDGKEFHCENPEMNPVLDREIMGLGVSNILLNITIDIVEHGIVSGPVIDINGNKVGEWRLE